MKIYVYEQDLLIREDIVETLSGTFAGTTHSVPRLEDILHVDAADVTAIVLSLSRSEAEGYLDLVFDSLPAQKIILIAGDLAPALTAGVEAYVPKPFSSDALVQAVKTVLSDPQRSLPET